MASLLLGLAWLKKALAPLRFVGAFGDVLREREFATRFAIVGQPELDALIRTYNRMLEGLYEERLRVGEERGFVERFLQATPIGVLLLDFDGRVVLANRAAAAALDSTSEALAGRRLRQLAHPLAAAAERLDHGRSELIQLGAARRFRVERDRFVDRGFDREFVLLEELTAILDASERAAYRKLVRLMSHEVNNTVASTNSLLQSCRTYAPQLEAGDRDDFVDALNVIIRRNDHLGAFMRELARVARLPPPDRSRTRLDQLIGDLEPMFRAGCAERGLAWESSLAAELPPVDADSDQLEQVLLNVVKNAMEATPAGGTVGITLARAGTGIRLAVHDTGRGIPETAGRDLFTPFVSSKPGGQGLGLTLVKEVLQQHGFDFSLSSEKGSTRFVIHFPPARADAADS